MKIFKCTKCGKALSGFVPTKCECGYSIPVVDGIYQFTDDSPISIKGDGLKWLGYELVGENYEPSLALGIENTGNSTFIGNCSKKLKEYLGNECVVLDLGAGLGQASIPLAKAGAMTIAVDISQKMLAVALERSKKDQVIDNLICTRMNAYKLKIIDNSIDAVVAIDMLHQVDHPELVISEVKRILKKDGIFVYYHGRPLDISAEQRRANSEYNRILKDITDYYNSIAEIKGEDMQPFYSWDMAKDCVSENFELFQNLDTDIVSEYSTNMKLGLHKLKTRASGAMQLIPEEIHKKTWDKTEKYARDKYGENYNKIERYDRKMGFIEIFKVKQ